jgi:uncharacterized SAM-binding protein YcdF (DUF218 family)
MTTLLSWLKADWHPSSIATMLTLFAIGVALSYTRFAKWGRRWLTAVAIGYWALATPAVAELLARTVGDFERVETAADAKGADAIVLLGGGIGTHRADGLAIDDLNGSAARVLEAVRVYRLLDRPLIFVSGGNTASLDPPRTEAHALRVALRGLGIPDDRIVAEDASMTTHEQAVDLKPILVAHHVERFVLVTSPTHMARALAVFRALGLTPIPSAAALRNGTDRSRWSLLPDRESLVVSDDVIYESLAWEYYRARGWLRADHGA